MTNLVAVTTIKQGDKGDYIQRKRSEIFEDTAKELVNYKIPCMAIYKDCDREYLIGLEKIGVHIIPQKSKRNMGKVRREALKSALKLYPDTKYFLWLEPEKPDIIKFVGPLMKLMEKEKSVIGFFNRNKMINYPPEQSYYYLLCRAVASELLGFDIDYSFGPMVLARKGIDYFLNYTSNYGDKWDSILIPRLRIIKAGKNFSILPINFKNDRRMYNLELGEPKIILKRLEQLNNVLPSLISEWTN